MKLRRINLVMVSMMIQKLKKGALIFADIPGTDNARVMAVRANPDNRMLAIVEVEGVKGWHAASAVFTLEPVPGMDD